MHFTIHQNTLNICNNGCMLDIFHCLRSWAPVARCKLVHLHHLGILMFFYIFNNSLNQKNKMSTKTKPNIIQFLSFSNRWLTKILSLNKNFGLLRFSATDHSTNVVTLHIGDAHHFAKNPVSTDTWQVSATRFGSWLCSYQHRTVIAVPLLLVLVAVVGTKHDFLWISC